MPPPILICIRHEVIALAREGMQQRAIAGRRGLTRAIDNHILWRPTIMGTFGARQVPGVSS